VGEWLSIQVAVMVVGVLGWSPVVSCVARWQQAYPSAEVAPVDFIPSPHIQGNLWCNLADHY
jgi:uncharacterized membrane protein